ncbi:uncharacterized protein METZ01_LOCUS408990, partial [marine metagenome]
VNINGVIVEKNPELGFFSCRLTLVGVVLDEIGYRGNLRIHRFVKAAVDLDRIGDSDRPCRSSTVGITVDDGRWNRRGRAVIKGRHFSCYDGLGYRVTTSDKDARGAEDECESVETRQYRHGVSVYGSLPLSFSS